MGCGPECDHVRLVGAVDSPQVDDELDRLLVDTSGLDGLKEAEAFRVLEVPKRVQSKVRFCYGGRSRRIHGSTLGF